MKVKLGQWQKRDGTTIQISDMDNRHLLNAITMCVQNSANIKRLLVHYLESRAWSALGYSCSGDAADGASLVFSQESDSIFSLALQIENSEDIVLTSKAVELISEAYNRNLKIDVPTYKILESYI